jgi:hypothetical protein
MTNASRLRLVARAEVRITFTEPVSIAACGDGGEV